MHLARVLRLGVYDKKVLMSAGSNVKVIGSAWFRHNSSGSVTCIDVAPG